MVIDFFDFIEYIKQERYRSCIIHYEKPSILSKYMKKVSNLYSHEIHYFNIINYFKENNSITTELDLFNNLKFFELLTNISKGKKVLLIDGLDLLFDTWDNNTKQMFFNTLKTGWDSFKDNYTTILIFCLITTEDLKSLRIDDSRGNNKIKHLSLFKDIS